MGMRKFAASMVLALAVVVGAGSGAQANHEPPQATIVCYWEGPPMYGTTVCYVVWSWPPYHDLLYRGPQPSPITDPI